MLVGDFDERAGDDLLLFGEVGGDGAFGGLLAVEGGEGGGEVGVVVVGLGVCLRGGRAEAHLAWPAAVLGDAGLGDGRLGLGILGGGGEGGREVGGGRVLGGSVKLVVVGDGLGGLVCRDFRLGRDGVGFAQHVRFFVGGFSCVVGGGFR